MRRAAIRFLFRPLGKVLHYFSGAGVVFGTPHPTVLDTHISSSQCAQSEISFGLWHCLLSLPRIVSTPQRLKNPLFVSSNQLRAMNPSLLPLLPHKIFSFFQLTRKKYKRLWHRFIFMILKRSIKIYSHIRSCDEGENVYHYYSIL